MKTLLKLSALASVVMLSFSCQKDITASFTPTSNPQTAYTANVGDQSLTAKTEDEAILGTATAEVKEDINPNSATASNKAIEKAKISERVSKIKNTVNEMKSGELSKAELKDSRKELKSELKELKHDVKKMKKAADSDRNLPLFFVILLVLLLLLLIPGALYYVVIALVVWLVLFLLGLI